MPSGPWIIRRPATLNPLVVADTRAAAFDVASREAIERELVLMVECDGVQIAVAQTDGRIACPYCGGSGWARWQEDICPTCAGSGNPLEDETYA